MAENRHYLPKSQACGDVRRRKVSDVMKKSGPPIGEPLFRFLQTATQGLAISTCLHDSCAGQKCRRVDRWCRRYFLRHNLRNNVVNWRAANWIGCHRRLDRSRDFRGRHFGEPCHGLTACTAGSFTGTRAGAETGTTIPSTTVRATASATTASATTGATTATSVLTTTAWVYAAAAA
jgi:hypothetical protein